MKPISNAHLIFAPSAEGQKPVKHLHRALKIFGVQGGCCSDRFVYQVMCGKDFCFIHKIDPKTWKTVLISDKLKLDHGNDMCFNPHKNEIIVVHNAPAFFLVSIFDADTLEFKHKVKLDIGVYGIDYDRQNRVYYVCEVGGHRLARLSENFKVEETFSLDVKGHVRQGITFFNGYLYMALHRENVIKIFDTKGVHVRTYPLPISKGEPENLFVYDRIFYIAYNVKKYRGGIIYRLDEMK